MRIALLGAALLCPVLLVAGTGAPAVAEEPAMEPRAAAPAAAPTPEDLTRLIAEQKELIAEQAAKIAEQEEKLKEQGTSIEELEKQLATQEQVLLSLNRRLEELEGELPDLSAQKALEERLKRVEESTEKEPELPPDVVSAGDFPGSIRIPGTDAAIKFGGRIRTAVVFTLGPLGSEDRFLTNSIPVEGTPETGKGARTSFNANTSRFNLEVRTPTGAGQMRAFIEGDFAGEGRAFRLRHGYAQYRGFIVGQTWSTFSDPEANPGDLDFEGINAENVIRQPLIRYWWRAREDLRTAVAAETPLVSLTGGQGVNVIPDLVARAVWEYAEDAHLQGALVFRQIRGETDLDPGQVQSAFAWGLGVSGVVPFRRLEDRVVFQFNTGVGNARYMNDLNSLGGQDAVFDSTTGDLEALPATGFYVDYQHRWHHWESWRQHNVRSSVIWGFVNVENTDFQAPESYHRTNRYCINLVFSPIKRIDIGAEYIYGTRENKDGRSGSSDQIQGVAIFRF
jgi:uncharacterized coiled-coil protein SlyX